MPSNLLDDEAAAEEVNKICSYNFCQILKVFFSEYYKSILMKKSQTNN